MVAAVSILALIVLVDTSLFSLSNVFPIGNVFDILNSVSTEYELYWGGLERCVIRCSYGEL